MSYIGGYLAISFIRLLALLPLPIIRGLGFLIARLLYVLIPSRRKIAIKNLAVCFPELSRTEIIKLSKQHFVYFVQAWLDRSWIWHASPRITKKRLRITGEWQQIHQDNAIVLFVPHFVGLDAAGIAVTQQLPRSMVAIYTNQSNPVIDAWVLERRARFGNIKMMSRLAGVKEIVSALRKGGMLALLPDMGFGPEECIYVPFFGVNTSTMPSLPRFAKLGKAKVLTIVSRMTPSGYDIEFLPAWDNYPTQDLYQDTLYMNQQLEAQIKTMPAQYFWVHKRFKHRPPGEASIY